MNSSVSTDTPAPNSTAKSDAALPANNAAVSTENVAPSVPASKTYQATDLKVVGKQTKSVFYALPSVANSVAYEPVEGKLALATSKDGLLFYDVDDVLADKLAAVVKPLKGNLSQICLKQFEDESYFVVAASDTSTLQLFHATTLEPANEIELEGISGVSRLAVSSNRQDPYIYFIGVKQANSLWSEQLGRFDMRAKKLQGPTKRVVDEVSVSRDGQFVFANGVPILDVDAAFNGLCRIAQEVNRPTSFSAFAVMAPPKDLGPGVGLSLQNSHSNGTQVVVPEFAFSTRPVYLGWLENGVSVFSTEPRVAGVNREAQIADMAEFREIERIALPNSWGSLQTASKTVVGDEQRGLVLAFLNSNMAVAKLPELARKEGESPSFVRHPMPAIVDLGTTIEFELDGPANAEIRIISAKPIPAAGTENIRPNLSRHGKWLTSDHDDKPTLSNRKFSWKPSFEQLGRFEIRFSAKVGTTVREWNWQTYVVSPSISPGFHAAAINCNYEGTKAVVWGQSYFEVYRHVGGKPTAPPPKSIVAIYDLKDRRVLNRIEVDSSVYSAAFDDTSVYVCDLGKFNGSFNENTPTKVKRYDLASGKILAEGKLEKHDELSIAGKYLFTGGKALDCGSLKQVSRKAPPEIQKRFSASTVGKNYMLDGVLWDPTTVTPQLLYALVVSGIRTDKPMLYVFGQQLQVRGGGAYLFDWNTPLFGDPTAEAFGARHYSMHFPESFAASTETLQVFDPSVYGATGDPKPQPAGMGGGMGGMGAGMGAAFNFNSPRPGFELLPVGAAAGSISSTADKIYSVAEGRIYEIPIERLVKEPKPFRIQEKQSTFILPFGRLTDVEYSAPGATKYSLYLLLDRSNPLPNETDLLKLESETGQFKVQLSNRELLRQIACKFANTSPAEPDPKALKAFRDRLVPEIARFTKTQILGVPIPISATVLAQRGEQVVCLTHEFIVDIPLGVFSTKPAKSSEKKN